jgi:hypothetical protein
VKSFAWTAAHVGARRPIAPLRGVAAAALLLSGLFTASAGPVAAAGPSSIVISPNSATIVAGTTQTYAAQGFDAHGNSLGDVTSATTFKISGTGSCTGASCGAKATGTYTVTGTDGKAKSTATLVVNPAPATTLAVSGLASPRTAGASGALTIKVLDPYGNVVIGYAGTIHFTSSDPAAVLPADYTFTGSDAGVHKFTGIVLVTAGSRSVSATDTASASIAGSQSGIVVNPGATILGVSGLPSPSTAGVAGTLTVTAQDKYGNTATGYLGTVHVTSSDRAAVLPADYAFTAADAGVHAFSVTLMTPGTSWVRARDTVSSTITGLASGIVVTPAAATSLTATGLPAPRTAGAADPLTVRALDQYGNVATGYLGTVHVASSDGAAVLPADYTFTAADAGVHKFTGIVLRTAGQIVPSVPKRAT